MRPSGKQSMVCAVAQGTVAWDDYSWPFDGRENGIANDELAAVGNLDEHALSARL